VDVSERRRPEDFFCSFFTTANPCRLIVMNHHAYLYEGQQSLLDTLVLSAKKQFGFADDNNPDLHVESFEKFGIEDAQELTRDAQIKSVSGRSLFILGIASINSHAQQALLKLFEEPQVGLTFVLLVPPGILLPTLMSRLVMYPERLKLVAQKSSGLLSESELPDSAGQTFAHQALTFLKAPYKARSTQIAALLKDDEGVKERVRDFLLALEAPLYAKLTATKGAKEYRAALEDITKVRSYLSDQSPSLKMLLEHLAATLPTL
jgi:DNA polymerase III delta prime subunit